MDPPVILPPNIEDVPPPGLALVEELDKLLLVQVGPLEQAGNRHRPWPPVPPAALVGAANGAASRVVGAATSCTRYTSE